MFPGVGTVINLVAIVAGAAIGTISGDRLTERTRSLITDVLGCVTLLGAASALFDLWGNDLVTALPAGAPILIILGSLLIGGLIGSPLSIEERLDVFGSRLRNRLGRGSDSGFVTGFVTASLLFVIGPLAILGSISDGMNHGIDQLSLKSTLDFFAAIAFASSFGWGVAFSSIPVALYQGLWTLIGFFLGSILASYQVAAMTATGGVLLLGIALRLLKIKEIAVGNLIPSLAVAPLLAAAVHMIG